MATDIFVCVLSVCVCVFVRVCRRYDVWFLSTHPLLNPCPALAMAITGGSSGGAAGGAARGSGGAPQVSGMRVVAVRSLWHGPDKDGRMRVEPVDDIPASYTK